MANVWMHNRFLQVEGQKMSKSLGNFVTINELLATEKFGGRSWDGEVLRLAMLMTHYREPIDFFGGAAGGEAEEKLRGLAACARLDHAEARPAMSPTSFGSSRAGFDDLDFHAYSCRARCHRAEKRAGALTPPSFASRATLDFLGFSRESGSLRGRSIP